MYMKILIIIFFLEIKENKIIRGHNFTLVERNKADWMLESLLIFQRTIDLMYGINYQQTLNRMCMLLPSSVNKYVQE